MRIAISTSVIQRGRSGVAQYVFALVKHLVQSSSPHSYTLFALEEDLPLFDSIADHVNFVSVPERFRPAVRNIFWHQTAFPRLLAKGNFDLAHVPSYRRLLWPKLCPLVGTIHDLAPFKLAGKYDWKRMAYARHVVRRLAQRQDRVIAVSHATAQDIERFFRLPRTRVRVIHNGLDHATFYPAANPSHAREFPEKQGVHGPFFLYIARLEHPAKNHVRLVHAFEKFKSMTGPGCPWRLVLGGSDWHGAEHIHAAIHSSPVASHIHTLGFIPKEDLPEWYRAATVFVYPSLFEGFGLPPVEAMACGCPVLCSARGSLAEVVGSAAAIVDPEDIDSMAGWLHRLATNDSLRTSLSTAGLAQAARFDWRDTARKTIEVYAEAAGFKTQPIADALATA